MVIRKCFPNFDVFSEDKRFDFLHPWHEFYNYYVHKRDTAKIMFSADNAETLPQALVNATPLSAATQGGSSPQITAQPELRKGAPDDIIRKGDASYQDDEDSMDVLDSPKDDEDSQEDVKPVKALKGNRDWLFEIYFFFHVIVILSVLNSLSVSGYSGGISG